MDPTSSPRPNLIRARRWPWLIAAATLVVFALANVLERTVIGAIRPSAASIWLPGRVA